MKNERRIQSRTSALWVLALAISALGQAPAYGQNDPMLCMEMAALSATSYRTLAALDAEFPATKQANANDLLQTIFTAYKEKVSQKPAAEAVFAAQRAWLEKGVRDFRARPNLIVSSYERESYDQCMALRK